MNDHLTKPVDPPRPSRRPWGAGLRRRDRLLPVMLLTCLDCWTKVRNRDHFIALGQTLENERLGGTSGAADLADRNADDRGPEVIESNWSSADSKI